MIGWPKRTEGLKKEPPVVAFTTTLTSPHPWNAAAADVATTVQGATVAQFETELASLTDVLFSTTCRFSLLITVEGFEWSYLLFFSGLSSALLNLTTVCGPAVRLEVFDTVCLIRFNSESYSISVCKSCPCPIAVSYYILMRSASFGRF